MPEISPELVLVDPELARRARAALPQPGASNDDVAPRHSQEVPTPAIRRPVVGAGAVAHVSDVSGHGFPSQVVFAATGLIVLLLAIVVPSFYAGADPVLHQPPPPSAGQRGATKGIGSAVASTDLPRTAVSRAAAKPDRHESAPSRVATRLFVWLPNRRARYYHVRFTKGKRTVFEAWPTDARVTVPLRGTFRGRSFAFTPGRYHWVVRPAFGLRSQNRLGEPIVRSVWVVP